MLAEMQSAMNNMVNNQLQNEFQLATLKTSITFSSSSSSSSSSSPCPGLTVASQPQPSAVPVAPSPSPPVPGSPSAQTAQSPLGIATSPPLCPSPGLDSTITAITKAHRETFVYAHDKLGAALQPQNRVDLDGHNSNCFDSGYNLNSLDSIYQSNAAIECNGFQPDNKQLLRSSPVFNQQHHGLPHQNNGQAIPNISWYGAQQGIGNSNNISVQNCPWKTRKDILLVSLHLSGLIKSRILGHFIDLIKFFQTLFTFSRLVQ